MVLSIDKTDQVKMVAKEKLSELLDELRKISSQGKVISEADTKAHFIDRYLHLLGYRGLEDIQREFYIKNSKEYIDYLLKIDDEKIAVEAKALHIQLNDSHAAQLIQYASIEGIEWCILTNAKEIRIYNQYIRGDLINKFVMKIDLLDTNFDNVFKEFWIIAKEQMASDILTNIMRERLISSEIRNLLTHENSTVVKSLKREINNKHNVKITPGEVVQAVKTLFAGRSIKSANIEKQSFSLSKQEINNSSEIKPISSIDHQTVKLSDLFVAGIISGELSLLRVYKGQTHKATLTPSGIIYNGKHYKSPSPAGTAITGKAVDGWEFWEFLDNNDVIRPLKELRSKLPNLIKDGKYKWKPDY